VVWKHRPIANEILAPRPKPSTAASSLPKDGSGIISSLDPPSTGSIERKEPIKMIQSSPEDTVRVNRGIVGFEKSAEISQSQRSIID